MSIESYRDLKVWQKAIDLTVDCCAATKVFPDDERFGLTSQIRRAAGSIAANIAEGRGRGSTKAFVSFLWIANGSLKELETHFMIAGRLGFLSRETAKPLFEQMDELGRMLLGLIRSLKRE